MRFFKCKGVRQFFLIIFVVLFYNIVLCAFAFSAVYYMPDDFPNLKEAFTGMQSGDTLIIRDGVYTGGENEITHTQKPPAGTPSQYTVVKAEHDGEVVFMNAPCLVSATSYIKYEGLLWRRTFHGIGLVTVASATPPHHIKFIKCGVQSDLNLDQAGREDGFMVGASHNILLEGCYAYGNMRYAFYVGKLAERVVVRRCVARIDGYNTQTDISAFMVYDARNVEIQNCIAIDLDAPNDKYLGNGDPSEVPSLFYFRNTTEGYDVSNVNVRDCIFLNVSGTFIVGSGGASIHFENDVFWNGAQGVRSRYGGASANHMTIGDVAGNTTWSDGWYSENHSEPITNSIIANISQKAGIRGTQDLSDYNALYNNATNYADATPGSHDFSSEQGTEVNIFSKALKYLVRVESGSELAGMASDGGSIGATVLYRIGVDGTMYGEPGYNQVTGKSLWPFPNEDLIRQKMRSLNFNGVSGKRGFCADGMTLTKYIWEYLGNPIPPEIYGGQDNTPPHADAGQDQTVEDSDNNGSEAVTLDGSGSYDSDGSITSYTWTENGQSIDSGVNPSVTLSVGTHQIQLTVTDNQGATSEDTVQVVVSPPQGDNSPPVITNVQASNISSQTATITWITDEPSSSNVEYGTSTDYGQAANSADLVTTHSVSLSGLQSSTTYHYRVSSTDSSGNTANSSDFTFTTSASSVQMHTLQDFEDDVLWVPGGNQDPTGNGRGWAFLDAGPNAKLEIDSIGANGTHHSLKITFDSDNPQIYFRSDDKTRDHMPEAKGANRMSFYVRFPEGFPIQQLPFRYDTWQLGTFIHDPNNWNDTHGAGSESDHGIHHYYHRFTIENVGNGWVKYIINTHPDQANYSGSTVPPDRRSEYFNNFGRFYFHFGPEAGGPNPGRPFTIWIDEVKFYYDDGSVGGQVHNGGQNDAGFDGQFFPDSSGAGTTPPTAPQNFNEE